jgi:hypothetical protein
MGDAHDLLDERERALAAWREAVEIFDSLHHPEGTTVRAKLGEHPAHYSGTS